MAAKTANVFARVEPDIKSEAEGILDELGVPASVLINMLYRQIIIRRRIPFDVSLPARPLSRDEMSKEQFDAMMDTGLRQAKEGDSEDLHSALNDVRKELTS